MLALVLKDLLIIRLYYLIVAAYMFLFGFVFDSPSSFLMLTVISAIMLLVSAISIEGKNKSESLVISFPVSRKEVVTAKYIVVALYSGLGLGAGVCMEALRYWAGYTFNASWFQAGASLLLIFSFASLYLPIYFRLGARSSPFILFITGFVGALLANTGESMTLWAKELVPHSYRIQGEWAAALLTALAYVLSLLLSRWIYAHKDITT